MKHKTPQKTFSSYTQLYSHLLTDLGPGQSRYILIALGAMIILFWLLVLSLIFFNREIWLLIIGVGVSLSLMSVILGIIYWLLFIAWSGSRDPVKQASKLGARLIVATPRPFSKHRGLSYKELKNLQQIAAIEQGAADWRGSFISLVIVGILFGMVSFILQPPTFLERWRTTANTTLETPVTINIPWSEIPFPPALEFGLNIFSFSIAIFILIILLIQLGRYYANFLATEPLNRIILFACTEALALIEHNNLQEKEFFTPPEKRFLARQLGYDFHSKMSVSPPLYIENGQGFYLEPLIPSRPYRWFSSLMLSIWKRQKQSRKSRSEN